MLNDLDRGDPHDHNHNLIPDSSSEYGKTTTAIYRMGPF